MVKRVRTQAMRVLEAKKIDYTVHMFPDNIRDAVQVAKEIGRPVEQVFKTLIVLREDTIHSQPLIVMIAADREIDLRQLARVIECKSVKMAAHEEAERLTGLKVGGISALALLNKGFAIYIDENVKKFAHVAVSGGQRGIDIELKVSDLLTVTHAQIVAVTRAKE